MPNFGGRLRNNPNGWFGRDPGFGQDDWLEAIAMYSPTQLAMGRKRSHATLTGYIPFDRITGCFRWMLGYSWVDPETKYLRREVPAVHPLFPTLFATEISECVGVKFITKRAAPHGWSLPYAEYTLARVTVAYSQPPYPILDDAEMNTSSLAAYRGEEMRRWCSWHPKSRVDLLELPGGMLRFDGGPNNGQPFLSPRTVYRAEKHTRKLIWWNVPEEFVMNDFGFMPKLDSAIGKINKDVFFGDPNGGPGSTEEAGAPGRPHTWLLEDVDTVGNELYADPIASAAFEGITRRLDLVFTLVHFNPVNGKEGSSEAGWRLNLAADGKWYPGKYSYEWMGIGVSVPQNIPFETEFLRFFTHHTDMPPIP